LGLFPLSGILENRKHDDSETGSVSVLMWKGEKTPTQLGPLERANLSHWIEIGHYMAKTLVVHVVGYQEIPR
jgi:hypothetical protein